MPHPTREQLLALPTEELRTMTEAQIAMLFQEPRIAEAAIAVLQACGTLTREERIAVLMLPVLADLERAPMDTIAHVVAAVAVARKGSVAGRCWQKLARFLGVKLALQPRVTS